MDERRPPVDERRPPVDERRPPVDERRPPVDERRPPVDERRPPVDERRPPVDERRPPVDERRPPLVVDQQGLPAAGGVRDDDGMEQMVQVEDPNMMGDGGARARQGQAAKVPPGADGMANELPRDAKVPAEPVQRQ